MSIENQAWSSDGSEFGYGEEWETYPLETREAIIAQADSESDFLNQDPEDCMPMVSHPAATTRGQDMARRSALRGALDNITEANKRLGLHGMTPAHPNYTSIDKKYGIDGARQRGEKFDEAAVIDLARACGNCAVRGCLLRDDYGKFEKKYHKVTDRNKLKKKLDTDPTTPC